jgi:hypothetical protein
MSEAEYYADMASDMDIEIRKLRDEHDRQEELLKMAEEALVMQVEWFGFNSKGIAGPDVEKKAQEALAKIREARSK